MRSMRNTLIGERACARSAAAHELARSFVQAQRGLTPELQRFGDLQRTLVATFEVTLVLIAYSRGVAQPGSAPALGAGGLEFKSPRPDQNENLSDREISAPEHLFFVCH
jgi:hypothetical protein